MLESILKGCFILIVIVMTPVIAVMLVVEPQNLALEWNNTINLAFAFAFLLIFLAAFVFCVHWYRTRKPKERKAPEMPTRPLQEWRAENDEHFRRNLERW